MALKTILHTEESGEILTAMFDDKTTEQELLTCAIFEMRRVLPIARLILYPK